MNQLKYFFNLHEGEQDKGKTLSEVAANTVFKGANLWILACAIMVASVGLNVNSTAVIIGAMLISPLMGPIVGAGFALGTYNFNLLKTALINLLVATLVSLLVSTIYFWISPFKEIQSELLARTSPTIYDVLIAFFGGLVGVIAITRVEKGNPIPGVAIATALMPPLCTAGYGIAMGNLQFFLGAFYLYCINCVFICIATLSIVKYLNYPVEMQIDERKQKRVRYIITALIISMLLPSTYLAYSLFGEQQFKKHTEEFIEKEFIEKGYTIVYKKLHYNETPQKMELAFLSKRFDDTEIETLRKQLSNYSLTGMELIFRQDSTDKFLNMKGDIMREINVNSNIIEHQNKKIAWLQTHLAQDSLMSLQLQAEAKIIFPLVQRLSIAKHHYSVKPDSSYTTMVVTCTGRQAFNNDDLAKLRAWLEQRTKTTQLEIFTQYNN